MYAFHRPTSHNSITLTSRMHKTKHYSSHNNHLNVRQSVTDSFAIT